ncbi:MAG: hypothetical protein AAFR75_12360 [Pseudomonadota bacterium]
MGQIVGFPKIEDRMERRAASADDAMRDEAGSAEILLFTGIRYERQDEGVTVSECHAEADEALETASEG